MLIDEFQQGVKGMVNYKTTWQLLLNKYPELQLYSKKFVLPLPADWSGW